MKSEKLIKELIKRGGGEELSDALVLIKDYLGKGTTEIVSGYTAQMVYEPEIMKQAMAWARNVWEGCLTLLQNGHGNQESID